MSVDWKKRLEERIKELGLTEAEVLRRAGLNRAFLSNLDTGKSGRPRIDSLQALAHAVGWSLYNLFDDGSPDGLRLIIQHRIQANEMWAENGGVSPKELPLAFLAQDLVTLDVETNDYRSSGYRRGDVVSGVRSFGRHIDNLIGLDCIIETEAGERLFKVLAKSSVRGRYTLKSFDPQNEDIQDAKIKWAAPVQIIIRGLS